MDDKAERNAQAVAYAHLDQMWSDLRQHKADLEVIADVGLPAAEDEGAAAHQDLLVRQMACVLVAELGAREVGGP